MECAETALYFVGDSVALQLDGAARIQNKDAYGGTVCVYFVAGDVRTGYLSGTGKLCLHLRTPEFSTENRGIGSCFDLVIEKYRDCTDANLYFQSNLSDYRETEAFIEQITVIPPLHLRQFLLQIIVCKHFFYFAFGKSEAVAVFGTQNAVNF